MTGDILLALVDELINYGAADLPDQDGRTALDRAQAWFAGGLTHYGAAVERLRTAATRVQVRCQIFGVRCRLRRVRRTGVR